MSKVKLEFKVPSSLSDITLGQYQEYLKILDANKDDENSTEFLNMKSLDIFCGLKLKDSYNVPVRTFDFALEQLQKCFSEKTPLVKNFFFSDINKQEQEMGFIPKLDDMSYGEYIDLDKYISDWQEMHKAMAVLYRPVRIKYKESYEIDKYNGTDTYADAMKETPLNIALGATVFFYRLGMKLSESTMLSLVETEEPQSPSKSTSQGSGDGIQAYMRLLRETLEDSMQHRRFHFIKQ